MDTQDLQTRAINTIRFLAADGVQKANSGHPGLPMGAAPVAYTLFTHQMRYNPRNPGWANRDRFILSGGHGSMLLYSMLYLTGYEVPLEELNNFRQWSSVTPGHPEYGMTPGVEVTTGPLGQGFGNGVGMAIAAEHLAARFNRPGHEIIDHFIYAIVTDGDLMEGVASESASLAGHLKLGRIIYLYDDNHISIDGSTDLAFTEDRMQRFDAYGWHTQKVDDGNDVAAIDAAIEAAKADPRPSIIAVRSIIGFGLPTRQGTEKAHGEPPGDVELDKAKENLGWPVTPRFFIPDDTLEFFRRAVERGAAQEAEWQKKFQTYRAAYPELASELERRLNGKLAEGWDQDLPSFPEDPKGMATRAASGKALNAIAARLPELLGGSADLAPSNVTWIKGEEAFEPGCYGGRNFHFGVREHGMGAVLNGMAVHGGLIPYGGTFLVFADYMRGAIRLSALSHYPAIWIFTHDSIGLGEDGPTHQPVEHMASLRAIPQLTVIRPADANEVVEAWKVAIHNRHAATVLLFSRQAVPVLDRNVFAPASELSKGAYVLADMGDREPDVILISSGSEVSLIVDAGARLASDGVNVRLVSFPSWELFAAQPQEYREAVLPPEITRRVVVEAGVSLGWERYAGSGGVILGIDRFGASAPYKTIYEKFGLTVDRIVDCAKRLLG